MCEVDREMCRVLTSLSIPVVEAYLPSGFQEVGQAVLMRVLWLSVPTEVCWGDL